MPAKPSPDFPTVRDLTRWLVQEKWSAFPSDDYSDIDVRLQVVPGEGWSVHTGDSSYDLDHRGYWGAGSLDSRTNCRELARELIGEAADHMAQCEV